MQAHRERVGEERCALVRAMVFANRAMASRGHLIEQARRWLDEAGTMPPGNGVERELWEARQTPGQRPWLSFNASWRSWLDDASTTPPGTAIERESLGGAPNFGCCP